MKKITILSLAAVLGLAVSSGFAQGTINFANSSTTLVTIQGGGSAPVTTTSGIKVELFYQPDPSGSLAPTPISGLGTIGNWEAISTLANINPLPGRFNGGGVTTGTDVLPAGNVWVDIVSYNGNYTSLQAALNGTATMVGYSTVWSQGTGDGGSVGAVLITPPTGGFGGLVLTPVPEPSTIVLGGLGAAALLAFRRRK